VRFKRRASDAAVFVPMLSIHVDTEDVLRKKHSGNPPTGTYILDIKDL
jgi:hypothetical protein